MPVAYITLVSSLPHLPHFERARRLPITERALKQRLSMLTPEHAKELSVATELLRYRREARTHTIEQQYRTAMENVTNPALREYVDWSIGWRTAIAALRFKAKGNDSPPADFWGVGRLRRVAERNWEKPGVGLNSMFPWIDNARQLLSGLDSTSLLRLHRTVEWRRLSAMGDIDPFGFEHVASYVFKWGILADWLSHDPVQAKQRFQELVEEVIGEREHIRH